MLPGPPQNVKVRQLSPNAVEIRWDPPIKNPDVVQWYRVLWRHVGSQSINRVSVKTICFNYGCLCVDHWMAKLYSSKHTRHQSIHFKGLRRSICNSRLKNKYLMTSLDSLDSTMCCTTCCQEGLTTYFVSVEILLVGTMWQEMGMRFFPEWNLEGTLQFDRSAYGPHLRVPGESRQPLRHECKHPSRGDPFVGSVILLS